MIYEKNVIREWVRERVYIVSIKEEKVVCFKDL